MKKITMKDICLLQLIIIIYTFSTVFAKMASGYEVLSWKFLFYFGMEFVILALYALLWQQMIKKFELSVAYINRSMALLWSMVWSVVFFKERITIQNVVGIVIVMVGIVVINQDAVNGKEDSYE